VPQVVSITPVGVLTAAVSSAEVVFNAPVNPYSVQSPGVLLTAPGGVVMSNVTSAALSPYRFQLNFDAQTAQGDYTVTVGPPVADLFGQQLSQVYTGMFAIAWTTVQGSITNSNGEPVAEVLVQSDGGGAGTTTDTNGSYVLAVPPGGAVIVTPSKSGLVFVPSSRTYWDVTTAITNENYLAVTSVTPTLVSQVESNSLVLSWYGIPGVGYQPFYSTDLVNWLPYGDVLAGSNSLLQLVVPIDTNSNMFFRMGASY